MSKSVTHSHYFISLGDEGPLVKKPSIDMPLLQAPSISNTPQAIAQAAIAKYVNKLSLA